MGAAVFVSDEAWIGNRVGCTTTIEGKALPCMVKVMPPWKYQILHPWHWLTYSQNAAALQALCALLGAIGLLLYVIDTRRMRRISELTLRASMTPIFTARDFTPHYVNSTTGTDIARINVTIRNVGEGPATVLWAWYQPVVSLTFSVFDTGILVKGKGARDGDVSANDLMKGDTIELSFDAYKPSNLKNHNPNDPNLFSEHTFKQGERWLFVVESIDQAQGKHQLKMLMTINDHNATTDVNMAHALGDTFGERVMKTVHRGVEIGLAIRSESARLFK